MWACDARVKDAYMNEPRSHLNESDHEVIMVEKWLKKI